MNDRIGGAAENVVGGLIASQTRAMRFRPTAAATAISSRSSYRHVRRDYEDEDYGW